MKNLTYLTFLIFCIFTFSACEKAEQGGCTDPYAENYESWADYDDGSCLYRCNDQSALNFNSLSPNPNACQYKCTDPYAINYNVVMSYPVCEYEGDVVFYLDIAAAQEFTNLGIPFLDVYVGNDLAGSMPTNVGFLTSVSCTDTDPEPVYFLYQWENEISTDMTWTVRDGTEYIWYSGTDIVLANNCLSMQLTWSMIKAYQDSH